MNAVTEPKDTRLIREITLRNILSFGPDTPPFDLRPLNVLIGPNGSGKSNLFETVRLMKSTADGLQDVIMAGGGAREWIWNAEWPRNEKGSKTLPGIFSEIAEFEATIAVNPDRTLNHSIAFKTLLGSNELRVFSEHIVLHDPVYDSGNQAGITIYDSSINRTDGNIVTEPSGSFLAGRWDPIKYMPALDLIRLYDSIRIYGEWDFGRHSVLRRPVAADQRRDKLSEPLDNLPSVINNLIERTPLVRREILERLREFSEGFSGIATPISSGMVELHLTEGNRNVPATRLSDGTLRYLCLLAILCDPEPPPLICIEEPELGLHPDVLLRLAGLLIEASKRTQIIVSTHSEILVDAMTENPEDVIVFDKHDGQTEMTRYDREDLKDWLDDFRLGRLWAKGVIGGNRW